MLRPRGGASADGTAIEFADCAAEPGQAWRLFFGDADGDCKIDACRGSMGLLCMNSPAPAP